MLIVSSLVYRQLSDYDQHLNILLKKVEGWMSTIPNALNKEEAVAVNQALEKMKSHIQAQHNIITQVICCR